MSRLRGFRMMQLALLVAGCALLGANYYLIAVGAAQQPRADIPEYRYTGAGLLLFAGFGVLAFCRTAGRFRKWHHEHPPEARFVRRLRLASVDGPYPLGVHTALAIAGGVFCVVAGVVVALNLI
jgi:hypothetical protein